MNRTILVIALAFVFCLSVTNRAQNKPSVAQRLDRMEQTIRSKEPGWTLDRKVPNPKHLLVNWRAGGEQAFVQVHEYESELEAIKVLRSETKLLRNAGEPEPVKNLADEASIWEDQSGKRSTVIVLRKGNILVSVNATSVAVAKRFARHVLDSL